MRIRIVTILRRSLLLHALDLLPAVITKLLLMVVHLALDTLVLDVFIGLERTLTLAQNGGVRLTASGDDLFNIEDTCLLPLVIGDLV